MRELAAALLTGLAAAAVSVLIMPPTPRAGPRMAPYAQRARLLLGRSTDATLLALPSPSRRTGGAFGPLLDCLAGRLSSYLDAGGDEAIARRCRHAGFRTVTPDQYRLRQLATTAGGGAAGAAIGLIAMPSGATVLAGGALGLVWGASRWRTKVDRAIARRCERMRGELYTVAHVLAIHIRAGTALLVAVEDLARRGHGPIAEELGDALDWISDGSSARDAFERLALGTPEPAAARLYRNLATADMGTGDVLAEALRHTANDLRTQRREDLERIAVRRRFLMLIPIVVVGGVVLVFIAAPIPHLIFGT